MTKLQWVMTLHDTGFVLQLGHKTLGLYPLRWLGRIILHRVVKRGFVGEYDGIPIYKSNSVEED